MSDKLRELAEKWRDDAGDLRCDMPWREAREQCADELAALVEKPAERPQLSAEPVTSPEVFALVQQILAHHQKAYATAHCAEGRKVIESNEMAIGTASVFLEQWINQREAAIRREAERAAFEKACGAICGACDEGTPLKDGRYHKDGRYCYAWGIRALAQLAQTVSDDAKETK